MRALRRARTQVTQLPDACNFLGRVLPTWVVRQLSKISTVRVILYGETLGETRVEELEFS